MTIDVDISEEESGEENDLGWKVTKSSKTKDRATGGAKEEEKLRMTGAPGRFKGSSWTQILFMA